MWKCSRELSNLLLVNQRLIPFNIQSAARFALTLQRFVNVSVMKCHQWCDRSCVVAANCFRKMYRIILVCSEMATFSHGLTFVHK